MFDHYDHVSGLPLSCSGAEQDLKRAHAEVEQLRGELHQMRDLSNADLATIDELRGEITALTATLASLRAALARAEETAARVRSRLASHYLAQVVCDHDRGLDNPICACSLVHLGWHPSVGAAVAAWVDHVMDDVQGGEARAADAPAAPCPCALANGDPCPDHDAPAAQHIRLLPEIGDDEAFRLYNTYTGADHGEAVISEMADAYIVLCVCEEEFVVEPDDDGLIDEAKRDEAKWMLYRHVARIAKAKAADALAAPNVEIERKRAAAARANGVKDCTVSISQGWCPVHEFGTPPTAAVMCGPGINEDPAAQEADAPAASVPYSAVWIAAARREIDYHTLTGDNRRTSCGRSAQAGGVILARADAVQRYAARPCPRCEPGGGQP